MSRVQSSSSASSVNIKDSAGNPLTSTGGALDVNVSGGSAYGIGYVYNEVTNISPGIETTIATYTVLGPNPSYLQIIGSAGQNIGEIRVYKNASVIDKFYLYYTAFNAEFDYRTNVGGVPGIELLTGDVILVTGLNNSTSTCNFNAKIQVLEAL